MSLCGFSRKMVGLDFDRNCTICTSYRGSLGFALCMAPSLGLEALLITFLLSYFLILS